MTEVWTLPDQADLVAGERRTPSGTANVILTDPNTGDERFEALETGPDDLEAAVSAAADLHRSGRWSRSSKAERAEVLNRIADGLDRVSEAIAHADALESGVPVSVTRLFAGALAGVVRGAVSVLEHAVLDTEFPGAVRPVRVVRAPWGPTAVIAPFNAPSFIAVKKTAYALAAGAPVICKPSPLTPTSANIFASVVTDAVSATGAPTAVFQLVHGDRVVGSALSGDPRIRALSFTGGRATGQAIIRASAADGKALQLELGSNNPVIVRRDADLTATARALTAGFTKLNGQWCESPGAVFVPRELHDPLLAAIMDRAGLLKSGSSIDPETEFGPQSSEQQYRRVVAAIGHLTDNGGTAHSATVQPQPGGWYVAPTVVTGAAPGYTTGEIFGPVLTLHATDTDEQSLELANSRAGGLAGYVFGRDETAALALGALMEGGEIKINGTSLEDLSEHSTQGFWGASGIGAHGNVELLQFFCGARIIGVDDPQLTF